MFASRSGRGRALHSGDDALMGTTATEVVGKRGADVGFAWALVLRQERRGCHDHSVDAVATLRGLLVDESLLELRWLGAAPEPFQRGDRALLEGVDRQHAGTNRVAGDMNSAGTALSETT